MKVVVTHDCRRGCHYCYNTLLSQRLSQHAESVLGALTLLLNRATKPISIEIIGGEPLEPRALPLTMSVATLANDHRMCSDVTLCTAIAVGRGFAKLVPIVDLVYLSIDISPNSRNRKRLAHHVLARHVRVARRQNVLTSVAVVLFGDETHAQLDRFVGDLVALGISHVGFTYQTDLPVDRSLLLRYVDLFHHLFRLRLIHDGEIKLHGGILDSLESYVTGQAIAGACDCGTGSVAIEPDGTIVHGVCADYRSGVRPTLKSFLGHISIRPMLLRGSEPCLSCNLWHVCHGGCPTRGYMSPNSIAGRDIVQCALLTELRSRIDSDLAYMTGWATTDRPLASRLEQSSPKS